MTHFVPSAMPDEGLGVLFLIRCIEQNTPEFFAPDGVIHVARAPGRLDVIGGVGGGDSAIALQLPTAEAACVAVQRRDDEFVRLWSPSRDGSRTERLSVRLSDLGLPDAPVSDADARAFFCADPRDAWLAHLLGGIVVLARDHGIVLPAGFNLLLVSDIPERRGAGSSAAIQVATLRAVAGAFALALDDDTLVDVCRAVDAAIARDPSPAASQRTAVAAQAGALIRLRGEANGAVADSITVPEGLEFIGLDLGVKAGRSVMAPAEVAAENERAARFAALLQQPASAASRAELGDLLFASHAGRGAAEHRDLADFIVDVARQRRTGGAQLWGATMVGRGALVVLGDHTQAWYEALRLKKALRDKTGHAAHVFRWSSPGSAAFGEFTLTPVGR